MLGATRALGGNSADSLGGEYDGATGIARQHRRGWPG
jgi:hypothetical protein